MDLRKLANCLKTFEDIFCSIVFSTLQKKHGSVQSIFDGSLSNFWSAYLPWDIWWHHHHMLNKAIHFIDQHQTQVKLFNVGTANHPWHLKPWCCCNGKCHYQDRVSTTWAYLRPRSQSHLAQHLRTWGTMNFLAAGVRFVRRCWVLVCVMKLTIVYIEMLYQPGCNRDHQEFWMFSRESQPKPSLAAVTNYIGKVCRILTVFHLWRWSEEFWIINMMKVSKIHHWSFCRVSPADDMKKDQTWLQVEWFAAKNCIQLL